MLIIGCDFHTRYQQIAIVREETGELLIRKDAVRFVTHPAIGPLTSFAFVLAIGPITCFRTPSK